MGSNAKFKDPVGGRPAAERGTGDGVSPRFLDFEPFLLRRGFLLRSSSYGGHAADK